MSIPFIMISGFAPQSDLCMRTHNYASGRGLLLLPYRTPDDRLMYKFQSKAQEAVQILDVKIALIALCSSGAHVNVVLRTGVPIHS